MRPEMAAETTEVYTSTEAGLEYRKLKREVRKKMKAARKSGFRRSTRT